MIGVAAAAALGIAVLALVSLRIAARHSERRSVRNYERALGALGKTSQRTDRGLVPSERSGSDAHTHVRTGWADLPPPRRPRGVTSGVPRDELRPTVQLRRAEPPTSAQRPTARRTAEAPRGARPGARRLYGPPLPEQEPASGSCVGEPPAGEPPAGEPVGPAPAAAAPVAAGEPRTELVAGVSRELAAAAAGLDELVARSRLARRRPTPDSGADPRRAHDEAARSTGRLDLRGLTGRRLPGRSGRPARAALAGGNGVRASVPGTEVEPDGDVATSWARSAASAPPAPSTDAMGEGVPIVFDFDELAQPPLPPSGVRPIRGLRSSAEPRPALRLATGAAAVVAIAALGVGVWQLATRTSPVSAAPPGKSGSAGTSANRPGGSHAGASGHHEKGSTTPIGRPTATTVPSAVVSPVSASPSLVVYRAPAGSYTLRFSVSAGECWVGAHNGSVWTWMATVLPATPATYTTSGQEVIRIGAPSVLSITLGGKPVSLPKQAQPYDVEFSPTAA